MGVVYNTYNTINSHDPFSITSSHHRQIEATTPVTGRSKHFLSFRNIEFLKSLGFRVVQNPPSKNVIKKKKTQQKT